MDEVDLGEHAHVGRLQVSHRCQHLRLHSAISSEVRRSWQVGCSSVCMNLEATLFASFHLLCIATQHASTAHS